MLPQKMHFVLPKFINDSAQFIKTPPSNKGFVPTSVTSVLQFCSIFSLFLQNCNKSLVLFKSYLSILSKHCNFRQKIFSRKWLQF